LRIIEATEMDVPELCDLLRLLFVQETEFHPDTSLQVAGLRQIVNHADRGRILVARDGARLVGMVSLFLTISTALGGPVALLEDMIVRHEYRRKGVGNRLLLAAMGLARSLDCRRITLLTDRTNEVAQRFYEKHGFNLSEMVPMRLVFEKGTDRS
jgi:GNAT superfamily N-acetyltransferase